MKETFTEEEYQEALKKFYSEVKRDFYNNKNNYLPYKGFIDLRNYNLESEDFKILWIFQDLLYSYEKSNSVLSSNGKSLYESTKSLYSNFIKDLR